VDDDVSSHQPLSPHHPITPSPRRIDVGETVLALAVVLFGIGVIWQTTQIRLTPAYSMVGPRVIPFIVGAGLVLTGLWLAFEALSGRAATVSTESEDVDPTLPTDWRTVGLLALSLLIYLVLLEPAGFIIASAFLFFGAAYAMGSRHYSRDLVIGILMAAILYVGFTRGLGLHLPAGILQGII
jgi:putative tricarboxylic transport membrane protein